MTVVILAELISFFFMKKQCAVTITLQKAR